MNLGDITALNNIGILEAIGAVVLFILLGNITAIVRLVKDRLGKKANCSEYSKNDLRVIVDTAIKRAIEIYILKEHKTINEQMACADKATMMIRSIIIDNFMELEQLKDHKNKGRDIRAYAKIIDFTMERAKHTIKEWIKTNHLLDMTDIEFQTYMKDTVKNLMMQVSSTIDAEYFSEDFIVDRDTLKKHNIDTMTSQIFDILSKLLMTIRNIAEEKKKEIEALEAESIFDRGDND